MLINNWFWESIKIKNCWQASSLEAFKKQSETIFVELNRLLKETNLDYKDIDRVIITKGPGSYTGIRIAMTIAKVLCSQMHKELYTYFYDAVVCRY